MIRIGKQFRFEAAHQLPNHRGKCARPHGHSYLVEVRISGPDVNRTDGAPDEGMLVDFYDVAAAWKQIEDQLDHRNLNETVPAWFQPTTAENIARYLLSYFAAELDREGAVQVEAVRVWETSTGWAEAWA